ncbi:helix-turn-helix transcriptional regulator [Alicyclobacillus cycloheptanicus]|uniref:Transcriptional regulator with XRE-family HTH domain n=1 Tax=Alicyclobacillus cycloheptanicus TaxID=1457 RepID=A0ABT9XJ53_9BACL|nr:XRE family transcriptional regulator [Alicyclobacillus cycloheptanicus]MDQ0190344.1 transcriptional regulator with XRE-family HTH domain [Alicyclobacillus cycloheptanicus]WDM00017.1 helix-turn-helix transcriptional regulator [Alicyclobacillus cycloheptanicus]
MSEFDYSKLREIRQLKGLTIKELAEACGVSASLISQVERGKVIPTLTVFWKICNYLDTPMHDFFQKQDSDETLVVRKNQRKIIQFPDSHVRYQLLSPNLQGQIEFLLVEIEPGTAHDPEDMVTHSGEECGFVLEGELIVRLSTREIHLFEGDSISFPSSTPHRFANPGKVTSRSIWAMTPPSF